MALVFEIIKGPGAGQRFPIRDGATIGRRHTSIVLEDSNVSGQHARIEDRLGAFVLVDVGSANGLKVQGKKVPELVLKAGLAVKLGRTTLRVVELDATDEAPALKPDRTIPWADRLQGVVERLRVALEEKSGDFVQTVKPFSPPLEMKFERGPQTGQSWLIGFGPRAVGARSVDLKILEPESPDICFMIRPSDDGPLFRTDHPDVVKVNGESRDVETLKSGDTIDILSTRISILIESE